MYKIGGEGKPEQKPQEPKSLWGGDFGVNRAKEEPKLTEAEELNWYVNFAKELLFSNYGIELTNTEYLYLRNIAKESIARMKQTNAERTLRFAMDHFSAEYEIPLLFIEQMYGIPDSEIPKKYVVREWSKSGEKFEFTNPLEARRKEEELEKEGKIVNVFKRAEATDDFKVYLKRKREAHHFE